ncbi:unnamed protein product [Blepharisma stoltei]|uniref:Kinesin-like protein n=1 Tax=Blepharisma stoltei TaxID=1481888 RepID=A0AAU9J693_9CILI|nr:unnamed protein product [Blepharisma stoltei]
MEDEDTGTGNVRVVCRFRPLNEKEKAISMQVCVNFSPDNKTVLVRTSEGGEPTKFNFDYVFTPLATQRQVYEIAAKPTVEAIIQGFNGTIFAYGQTSSGKTFSMTGPDLYDEELMGIIPRMVSTVFENIVNADEHLEFQVKVAYCEIYMEKIKDLLDPSKTNLKVHEDKARGVYIADLTEKYVGSMEEVYDLMAFGTSNREVGYTHMNAGSSRSHSLFCLTLNMTNKKDLSSKTGKLYLVDLAGSEKVGKTGAEGKRLEEAKNINKSLTSLGQVITALTDGKSTHVPYRDSKLTRVLQDSLGGNSKTALIITCSPSPYNEAETISTLRFGIRAKSIKNKPRVNREYTVAELKLMLDKAKEEMVIKDKRILQLEGSLKTLGAAIPPSASGKDQPPEAAEEEQKNESSSEEEEKKEPEIQYIENKEMIQELEDTKLRLSEEVENSLKLKAEILKKDEEIEDLKEQNENLNEEVQSFEARYKLLEDTLTIKEERIDALTDMNASLESEIEALNDKVLKLSQKISEKTTENEQLIRQSTLERQVSSEDEFSKLKAELEEERGKTQWEKEKNQALTNELKLVQRRLDETISVGLPKMDKLRNEIIEEVTLKERERWNAEKRTIMKDLQTRVKQVIDLEIQLDELREVNRNIESNLSIGEKELKKKTDTLERNLEQLTLMYHQLVSEKSKMSVESKITEKKIARITDKNKKLEESLAIEKAKLAEALNQVQTMSNEMNDRSHRYSISIGNIRKTIQGGGGKVASRQTVMHPLMMPIQEERALKG